MALEDDRVRKHTAEAVLARIDSGTYQVLLEHAQSDKVKTERRVKELDEEWDTDRTIETEAALMAFTGLALGAVVHRKFFALPGVVASMLFLHATTGWYPLLPLFRRLDQCQPPVEIRSL